MYKLLLLLYIRILDETHTIRTQLHIASYRICTYIVPIHVHACTQYNTVDPH